MSFSTLSHVSGFEKSQVRPAAYSTAKGFFQSCFLIPLHPFLSARTNAIADSWKSCRHQKARGVLRSGPLGKEVWEYIQGKWVSEQNFSSIALTTLASLTIMGVRSNTFVIQGPILQSVPSQRCYPSIVIAIFVRGKLHVQCKHPHAQLHPLQTDEKECFVSLHFSMI